MEKVFKIFVLEDDPERINQFVDRFQELSLRLSNLEASTNYVVDHDIVDNAKEAKELLEKNVYDLIFLDHDLGGKIFVDSDDDNTGSEVARWLSSKPMNENNDSKIIIHSFNPTGADYMNERLDKAVRIPSIWTKELFHYYIGVN